LGRRQGPCTHERNERTLWTRSLTPTRRSIRRLRAAWMPGLVKVDYAGYEGDLCAYVWRDQRRKTHVKWDGAWSGFCEHWEYHY